MKDARLEEGIYANNVLRIIDTNTARGFLFV